MPDVFENAGINQFRCFLERIKRFFIAVAARLSGFFQLYRTRNNRVNGVKQDSPRKYLVEAERIIEPEFVIGGQKPGDTFPTKEPVKSMAPDVE